MAEKFAMSNNLPIKNWLELHSKIVIFFLVVSVVCGLSLVTEKLLSWRSQGLGYAPGTIRYIKLREFPPGYHEVLHPSKQAVAKSDSLEDRDFIIRVDKDGFIMPSRVHNHPDLTLFFLGGSTTECVYVEEYSRFPYLAGHLLEEKTGLLVNSYNGARSGNDSLHSLDVLLNKVVNRKPDLVVWMHNINDLTMLLYEGTYWNKHPSRGPILAKPPTWKTLGKDLEQTFHLARDLVIPNLSRAVHNLSHSGFKEAQADEFQQMRGRKIEIHPDFLMHEFTLNLQTFINICQARQITPVLMTMPNRLRDTPDPVIAKMMEVMKDSEGIRYRDFKAAFDRFNQIIREVAAHNRVLVVDLAREIPQDRRYMADVVHLNTAGSQLVAEKIAETLTPLVIPLKKKAVAN